MRTHLRLFPTFGSAGSYWQIGLIIGRDADVGTVNPNVNAEPELDWMLDTVIPRRDFDATAARDDWLEVDLRAKRKMQEMGQRYIFNFYNSDAASQTMRWFARTLVALP
jgi:hypothetical protein